MSRRQFKAYEIFNKNKARTNYPQWPNESMLKLVFGDYLENKIMLDPRARVLDVGCGFGNNLLPFLVKGYQCFGTEVTAPMAHQAQEILEGRGFKTIVKEGKNTQLPFDSNFFDLVLSINVIHYEGVLPNILLALKEYNRVLKKGGRLFLMTVGLRHVIIQRAKLIEPYSFQIRNYDFRNGTRFFCFKTEAYLKKVLSENFVNVETGRLTEKLMRYKLDFLIGASQKK